ncbi:hypothetical protein CONPUDRAFT_60899 [Coniophora puteana RWD-64-598 SS2]|uniref:Uncharacterized protein n=1 Tax=Coniophora puteana (strain RWD-64-598) TaxID=741705 RepID=A0A5M3MHM4_CONPW|nr:uncharacterized protein CONPUDRAFT_60899 [Coniophora puteana RWD-64-598 SS2]EIW78729.1 hypothetical protein CONPUDRAFT_60899 [Coniophora puteana RWD-64-598 SS2]
MLGNIMHKAPELLKTTACQDGSMFKCSDAYVCKFLYANLHWVPRTSTRAAQKVPENAGDLIFELFIRLALLFRDAGIRHPSLYINFDQTQVIVANPST